MFTEGQTSYKFIYNTTHYLSFGIRLFCQYNLRNLVLATKCQITSFSYDFLLCLSELKFLLRLLPLSSRTQVLSLTACLPLQPFHHVAVPSQSLMRHVIDGAPLYSMPSGWTPYRTAGCRVQTWGKRREISLYSLYRLYVTSRRLSVQ